MVSNKHKCIFIHIPKVAGQSIELFFLNLNKLDWSTREELLLKPNSNPKKGPPRLAHLKSNEYLDLKHVSHKDYNNFYKFSFVRNPWDRLVSLYKFSKINQSISFQRFVKKILPKLIKNEKWFYGKQYDFIYHKNKLNVDFVGKFENLHQDFSTVCDKLNIKFNELPHKNKSIEDNGLDRIKHQLKFLAAKPTELLHFQPDLIKSRDYREYYTSDELVDLVYKMYKEDVETFNYKFDN